jgi:hypothetical protein
LVEYNVAYNNNYIDNEGEEANCFIIFNCNNCILQYNEVYNHWKFPPEGDGGAFDVDYRTLNNIVQYNYDHDNGMSWVIPCQNRSDIRFDRNTIFRYNISQNAKYEVIHVSGGTDYAKFYNNVIYLGTNSSAVKIINQIYWEAYPDNISYFNNIIYNLGSNNLYSFSSSTNTRFDTNVFYGNHPSTEPADPNKLTSNPKLVNPGSGSIGISTLDGYKLQSDSPCINSGLDIPENGGKDFWGNPVPHGRSQTDRGAYESDTAPAAGDFDTDGDVDWDDLAYLLDVWLVNADHWETNGLVVIEAENYSSTTAGNGSAAGESWQLQTGNGSLGTGYMQALPDSGIYINSPVIEANAPKLSYKVHFETSGTYYLWLKCTGPSKSGDRIHYGLNGVSISTNANDSINTGLTGVFGWCSTTTTGRPSIQIPSSGSYSIDLWMAEDGAEVDRLLLTTNMNYTPVEPDESSAEKRDLYPDGEINFKDFALFATGWTGTL